MCDFADRNGGDPNQIQRMAPPVQRPLGASRPPSGRMVPDEFPFANHLHLSHLRLPGQGRGAELHEGQKAFEHQEFPHCIQPGTSHFQHLHFRESKSILIYLITLRSQKIQY